MISQFCRASKEPYPAINLIGLIASALRTDPVLAITHVVVMLLTNDLLKKVLLVNACLVSNLFFDLTLVEPLQVENL